MNKYNFNTDDCYFFIYSECTKGTNCPFRHSTAAKSSANTCRYWKNGCCMKKDCGFRHIRDNIIYEKVPQKRHYPFYGVRKLDKHVILPAKRSGISEVKKAINPAVFYPGPEPLINDKFIPYPIEPVVINLDDEDSDSESDSSTPEKVKNEKGDSSTVNENLSIAVKRKDAETPFDNKNPKRMKLELSPSNLCNNLPVNDVKSNSTSEKQIKITGHPVLKKNTLSSSTSDKGCSGSYQRSNRPAVNILNNFLPDDEELDYEPDDVLP